MNMREDEVHSIFDQFETDEETGEVIIPRATVGVVTDVPSSAEETSVGESIVSEGNLADGTEELPKLDLDFNFTEEDLVEVKPEEEDDEILQSIDAALAQEMASTMGKNMEELPEEEEKKKNIWLRIPLWCRALMITLGSLLLICALIVGTKPGRKLVYRIVANYVYGRMPHPSPEATPVITEVVTNPTTAPTPSVGPDGPEVTPPLITPAPVGEPRHEDYCYNVLLIGYESLEYFGGQRSDSMILVSINKKDKKIRMTSLLRDMYVKIEGVENHEFDKLNSAYAYGGERLLIDTIEKNFLVKIDDYVIVGFDNFEWIIDRLGGVEVTLSQQEANYLNTTRYITKPQYRNVVAGTQVLNGNQALGYCRVRYVPTINGTDSDFGRTERQRMVLTKLFNKYKETNIFTLLGIMNDCLPKVVSSISRDAMAELLESVVEERILSLESMRIPVSGSFENVYVGKAQVLRVDFEKNINALHKFIFGEEETGQ